MEYSKANLRTMLIITLLGVSIGVVVPMLDKQMFQYGVVSYTVLQTTYISFVLFSITLLMSTMILKQIANPSLILIIFVMFYYSIGMLNLSEYRGSLDLNLWTKLVLIAILSSLMGIVGANSKWITFKNKEYELNKPLVYAVCIIGFSACIYVFLKNGILLFNPDNRFGVSGVIQYLIEFLIPVTVLIVNKSISESNHKVVFIVSSIVLLALFSLGYRNQPLILIISIVLSYTTYYREKIKRTSLFIKSMFSLTVTLILFCFSLLYLVRQESSENLFSYEKMVDYYHIKLQYYTLYLVPFHMQAREAMGVTTVALQRQSEISSIADINLFFQDILTILPNFSMTGGNVLGIVVNMNENVSLTPGLIGGLYLSFGYFGVLLGFFLLFLILSLLARKLKYNNFYYNTQVILCLVYSIELINRGLFKPMYVIIPVLLMLLVKKRRCHLVE